MLRGMRGVMLAVLLLAPGGCDTPGRAYAGLPVQRLEVEGSVFDVRIRGDIAQAIRVNSQWAPHARPVWSRAIRAVEMASGCRVTRLEGDQVVIEARLDCDGTGAVAPPRDFLCDVDVLNKNSARVLCAPGL